jgi:hypothetical protein
VRIAALIVSCVACHVSCSASPDAATPSTDELIAACEVDDACVVGATGSKDVNDCLAYWTRGRPLLQPQIVHCMAAAAGDCVKARACIGRTVLMNPSCSTPTSCMGDKLSQCSFGLEILTDCTVSGAHCLTAGSATACAVSNACTADSCDGTKIVRCNQSLAQRADCADIGDTCVLAGTVPDQTAECRGIGAACTGPRIDGNTLVTCDFGFEHRVDCNAAVPGGTVQHQTTMNGPDDYCGLGTACEPGAALATCTNGQLTMCVFGTVRSVDCTALGYTGCDSNAQHACKPPAFL